MQVILQTFLRYGCEASLLKLSLLTVYKMLLALNHYNLHIHIVYISSLESKITHTHPLILFTDTCKYAYLKISIKIN